MTIMTGKEKVIQFSHADVIQENVENKGICNVYTYTPELPTITCSNKQDAEYIQQKVNTLIREITHELLDKTSKKGD